MPALGLLLGALALLAAGPAAAQVTAPSVPRNVSVTPGDEQLTLGWQAPSSWGTWTATGFEVQWKFSASTAASWAHASKGATATETSYVFTGLQEDLTTVQFIVTNGTSYDLRIRSFTQQPGTDGSLDSHFRESSWVTVANKIPTGPPEAPAVTAAAGLERLDVSWTAPSTGGSAITGYDVQYKTWNAADSPATGTNPATGWVAAADGGTATTAAITGLTGGEAYYVARVRAENANGSGEWSSEPVWSARLTVGDHVDDVDGLGCDSSTFGGDQCSSTSVLTHESFSIGATDLEVRLVVDTPTGLRFHLQRSGGLLSGLTLCADTTAYAVSSAVADGVTGWRWNVDAGWSNGDQVFLRLQRSSSCTAVTVRSPNANLSGLTATTSTAADGTFSALNIGAFAAGTTSYTATVAGARRYAKLTPTAAHSAATVTVRDATVTSGSASAAIALNQGSNTLGVRVTAENGTTKDYTVTITRQTPSVPEVQFPAVRNYLVNEGGTTTLRLVVSPAPASDITVTLGHTAGTATAATGSTCEAGADYVPPASVTVAAGQTRSALITLRPCHDRVVEVDNEQYTWTIASGTGYTVGHRSSTTVTIRDGTFTVSLAASPNPVDEGSTVTVTATRSAPGPAANIPVTLTRGTAEAGDYGTLASIGIGFAGTTGTATISTAQDADTADETFTVALNTASLPTGHAAGSTSSVVVTITDDDRSSDANLSGLTATGSPASDGTFSALTLRPSFAASVTDYAATAPNSATHVPNSVTHVKLTPTARDSNATVEVGKGASLTAVTSGSASGAIAVAVGTNAITVKVTADDAVTTKTYTVTVTRDSAQDSTLTGLSLSAGGAAVTLTPTFATGKHWYTAGVPADTASVNVTATWTDTDLTVAADSHALDLDSAVTASGEIASSGAGKSLDLAASGITRISVSAAENGGDSGTYRIDVTRLVPLAAPTDLTVLSDYKRLDVSWTAPPVTVTGYDVHYASMPVTAWVPATRTETSPPTASQTISSLTNGTTYRVRVRATTSANVGAWAYGGETPVALGRPLNLSVEPGDKRLRLFWDRNYGGGTPTSYTVHYTSSPTVAADAAVGTDAATEWVDTGYGGALSQYTIAGLTNGTTYRVRVSARRMDDGSPYAEGSGTPSRTIITIRRPVTVSISARPNPVAEGSSVTVTATLSRALTRAVTIPLTLTAGTAETGDHGALASVTINAGATTGTGTVAASQDADTDDETFTVALGSLPSAVTAGSPASVQVTIADDDTDGGDPPTGGPPTGGPGGPGGPPPPPDDEEDDEDDGDDGGPPPGSGGGGPPRAKIATDAECEAGLCRGRTGEPVSFEDASAGSVRSRTWDFGDGGRSRSASPSHAWTSPGFYEVALLVSDGSVDSTASLTFLVEAAAPAGTCVADDETRCLADSRFAVEAEWSTAGGESGTARVAREGTNESGMFWFFGENNWEVLIKVLDGCAANGHAWVFGASTTDLGYVIRVSDTATGTTKEYRNEPGTPAAAITDVKAFPDACASG